MGVAPESVLSCAAELGEGPVWVARDQALWFVDIKGLAVWRFDPLAGDVSKWSAPEQPGWIVPATDGAFLVGMKSGIHRFDPCDGGFDPLYDPEPHLADNRLNDATVAADGAVWLGTMDDVEIASSGGFYRFDGERARRVDMPAMCITNGPAISPDQRLIYFTDTLDRRIWRCRLEQGGAIGPAERFVQIEGEAGYPDGCTVDADGCLWTGLFGGWAARRYDPDGRLMTIVPFPTANVTKIAFGGADLATVYATTARKGLSPAELADQPLAGNLFAFDPGTKGAPGFEAQR